MRPLSEAAVALLWLLAATTASAQAGDEGSQPTHAHTGSAAPGANPTPTAPQSTTASPSPTTDGAESPATDDAGAAEDDEDEGDPYDFLWVELFGGWSWVDPVSYTHLTLPTICSV